MADKYAVYKKQLKEEEKKYKNLVNESEKVFNNFNSQLDSYSVLVKDVSDLFSSIRKVPITYSITHKNQISKLAKVQDNLKSELIETQVRKNELIAKVTSISTAVFGGGLVLTFWQYIAKNTKNKKWYVALLVALISLIGYQIYKFQNRHKAIKQMIDAIENIQKEYLELEKTITALNIKTSFIDQSYKKLTALYNKLKHVYGFSYKEIHSDDQKQLLALHNNVLTFIDELKKM